MKKSIGFKTVNNGIKEGRNIMKKILCITIVLLIGILTGCRSADETVKFDTLEDCYVEKARSLGDYESIYSLISLYDDDPVAQEAFVARLAAIEDNETVQKALLLYDGLSSENFVYILENHKWKNIKNAGIRQLLISTIATAELSYEEELRIAKLNVATYQAGLLYRDEISCDALCYIADKDTTSLNLDFYKYRELFYVHGYIKDWGIDEREKLLNTKNKYLERAFVDKKEVLSSN